MWQASLKIRYRSFAVRLLIDGKGRVARLDIGIHPWGVSHPLSLADPGVLPGAGRML